MVFRTMMIILALLITLVSGCSLGPDGNSSVQAGPRLLQQDGQTTFLSHPSANDYAPQIVTLLEPTPPIGAPGTNRYIYFISDRPYSGSNTAGVLTNKVKQYAIFRAKEVAPQLFKNLQLVLQHDEPITGFYVVVDGESASATPGMFVTVGTGLGQLYRVENPYTSFNLITGGQYQIMGGLQKNASSHHVYVKSYRENAMAQNYTMIGADTTDRYLSFNPNGDQFKLDMTALFQRTLKVADNIEGCAPIRFNGEGASEYMGLVLSHNGVLHIALNTLPGLDSSANTNQLSYTVKPLTFIDHSAGTKDITPAFDPLTGLYFSSNRGGQYDLYFVPLVSLLFEGHYSPQMVSAFFNLVGGETPVP